MATKASDRGMLLTSFSVRQPILVNLLMVIILVYGFMSYLSLPRELDPDVSFQMVLIRTVYKGASPSEIERYITIPIEEKLKGLSDVKEVYSVSAENYSAIFVEFGSTVKDLSKAAQDVQTQVNKVSELPSDAETPEVIKLDTSIFPIIAVVMSGGLEERRMKILAEALQDEILEIDGVASADIGGLRKRQIRVEVDPQRLESYRLSFLQVADALKRRNLNLPGGLIKSGRYEYLVRVLGEFRSVREIEDVIVKVSGSEKPVYIRDIGRVIDAYEEPTSVARLNGRPALAMFVQKKKKGNAVKIIESLKEVIRKFQRRAPKDIQVALFNDTSVHVKKSIQKLKQNAVVGICLVSLILIYFLGFRNSLLALFGIPFAFLCTFGLMRLMEISINTISLFSLILVLGMIVDDAIIVLENSCRYMEMGHAPVKAAVIGAGQVATPVISAILTTVAAFLPMLLMTGIIGDYMAVIPKTVTVALMASLIEALLVLPSHVAEFARPSTRKMRGRPFIERLKKGYIRALKKVLRHRVAVLLVLCAAAAAVGIAVYLRMKVELFPSETLPQFDIKLYAPVGTRLEETKKLISRIEERVEELPRGEVDAVISRVGMVQEEYETKRGSHLGMVTVDLAEQRPPVLRRLFWPLFGGDFHGSTRTRSLEEIVDELRRKSRNIPGISSLSFAKPHYGPPSGQPVEIKILGPNWDTLKEISKMVKDELRTIMGVADIRDDLDMGKKEVRITVDEEKAKLLGISVSELAMTVRMAFEGYVATEFRDGDEEVDVVVTFDRRFRNDIGNIEKMKILSAQGELVPFKDVASISVERGYRLIKRMDFERAITVTADVDTKIITSKEVNDRMIEKVEEIKARFPGYRFKFGGEYEKTQESFRSLKEAFVLALLLIYMILATQFGSFTQPFIVMSVIPFASIGVLIGLLLTGEPFSIPTMVGVVALTGIVVNDSLVLIDFINKDGSLYKNRWHAIMRSGKARMRPILLTSLTTVLGLLPMALGVGGESKIWRPLASAIIWGLTISTLVTLFFVPVLYAILGDIRLRVSGGGRGQARRSDGY